MAEISDMDDSSEPLSAREMLRRRDFAIYWWSGFISSPGNWMHNVTASVVMYTLTESPLMVGLLNFAIFIPNLLISLPAGVLGDRFDRRWVVALSNGLGALAAVALTILSVWGNLEPASLIALCFVIGCANPLAKPALSAMIPALVPRESIGRATALYIVQFQFGQTAGPGLAALLLLTASPSWAFGLNALSYLAPIVAMLIIRFPEKASSEPSSGERQRGSIMEGLRYIFRDRTMRLVLIAIVLANGAVEALRILSPSLAAEQGVPEAAGLIVMGYSIGGLLGLVFFGQAERHIPPQRLLPVAFALQAIGLGFVAVAPTVALMLVAAIPIGVGFSLAIPRLSAGLQLRAADSYRSRVMAAFTMAHLGLRPFFALLAGALATLSIDGTIIVFVVLALAAAVFVGRRNIVGPDPKPLD